MQSENQDQQSPSSNSIAEEPRQENPQTPMAAPSPPPPVASATPIAVLKNPSTLTKHKKEATTTTTTTPSASSRHHHHHHQFKNYSSPSSVPNSEFFLLGAPPSVSIAAKTTSGKKSLSSRSSKNNISITGTENFFKQHVSFVHDQPSELDFVPNPNWFEKHNHQEFLHLQSSAGSSKIDRNHQQIIISSDKKRKAEDRSSSPRESYYHPYSPSSLFTSKKKSTSSSSTKLHRPTSDHDDENEEFTSNHLRSKFHQRHSSSPGASSSSGRTNQNKTSQESLHESLNALRRRQAIRTAMESGNNKNNNVDDDDNDDSIESADYWLSPSQQEVSERRIRESKRLVSGNTTTVNETQSSSVSSSSSALKSKSFAEKLKAFTSKEQFGEELIFALLKDFFESILTGIVILTRKIGNWFYGLGYFMIFGETVPNQKSTDTLLPPQVAAASSSSFAKNTGNHTKNVHSSTPFPSPFPQFYREAFFSTWSPHEILEQRDLPMTNAFMPTPLPPNLKNNAQKAVEMLRPTPAPPFWWLGMMEISGRHFIETQWSQSFSQNIFLPSLIEARKMWLVHEDEVMRGHDLIKRVERRGDGGFTSDDDDANDEIDYASSRYLMNTTSVGTPRR